MINNTEFCDYSQYQYQYSCPAEKELDDQADWLEYVHAHGGIEEVEKFIYGFGDYFESSWHPIPLVIELPQPADTRPSYDLGEDWLREYIKSISPSPIAPPPEPEYIAELPEFNFEQQRWYDEQLSYIPLSLRTLAEEKYRYTSLNGKTDGECLRLANIWLRETLEQLNAHQLYGTMHHAELSKQLIKDEYRAPPAALNNFTGWVLKNAHSSDAEIKNIAYNMSQQFHSEKKNDTSNNSGSISIINAQKLTSKLGQFWCGYATENIDRNELIKQISLALRHATQVFNIKFKKWSPNHFIENNSNISDFLAFVKQTRNERDKNNESNPRCPTAWAAQHCYDQSIEYIEKLANSIIDELNINLNLINKSLIRNRLGIYADPFFREKDPLQINERNLRRQLRKAFRRCNESAALCLRKVSATGEKYISDFTLDNRSHQINAQSQWINRTYCKSVDGDKVIPLKKCIRSPEAKAAELYTLVKGLDRFCTARGDKAAMVTITTPPRFHPNPAYGASKWDGSSPMEAHAWFVAQWELFRTAISDARIKINGLRVVEPHKDGTPHYHLMVFVKPKKYDRLTDIFNEYFGHSDKAIRFDEIDPNKGSASGYLLKYIYKNISGMSGTPAEQDSAARADAFRATWGIRAFSHFGLLYGRVTTWRELRRLETQPDDTEKLAKALWRAARGGDGHKFVALLAAMEKTDRIKTVREPVPTCEFTVPDADGEIKPIMLKGRILGIQINKVDYLTHVTKWTLTSLIRTDDALAKEAASIVMHKGPRRSKSNPPDWPESSGFRH